MYYYSTRDRQVHLNASEAIKMGLSRDGGLLTPNEFPSLNETLMQDLCRMSYEHRAAKIMSFYLTDFTEEEILSYTTKAYQSGKFDTVEVAPVRSVGPHFDCLELWHGPTSAFKDMALQMLPYLLTASLKKTGEDKTVCILVATSGDTGKAALEGFADVDQTKIMVFYPKDGVSDIQKLQMVTQTGDNVGVCSVIGNFDDAQNGVKRIFSNSEIRSILEQRNYILSSANSINWGRILPQVCYYISSYCDLINQGKITYGDSINFCVPTGNFGNILAGYFAKRMGLPIHKLLCASNSNNILTDFIQTGIYDRNRPFYTTMSPSMDILISSNLERLLFELSEHNDLEVRSYMSALQAEGHYEVSDELKSKIQNCFWAGFCTEEETLKTIDTYEKQGYLIDPHTAVAMKVMEDYRVVSGDTRETVVVSTASPYKFCSSVLTALGRKLKGSGIELLDVLKETTGVNIPKNLESLKSAEERFTDVTEKQDMEKVVLSFLK